MVDGSRSNYPEFEIMALREKAKQILDLIKFQFENPGNEWDTLEEIQTIAEEMI